MSKCDGICNLDNNCSGKVKTVRIVDVNSNYSYKFNYCNNAIKSDLDNGFEVYDFKTDKQIFNDNSEVVSKLTDKVNQGN